MEKLKIFYDGKCHLCYQEITHYLKLDKKDLLTGVDIADTDFDASFYDLDQTEVNIHMHAADESGRIYKGIDAFIEIWKRLPLYSPLVKIVGSKFLRPVSDIAYDFFAKKIRPNLPKRKCASGACSIN